MTLPSEAPLTPIQPGPMAHDAPATASSWQTTLDKEGTSGSHTPPGSPLSPTNPMITPFPLNPAPGKESKPATAAFLSPNKLLENGCTCVEPRRQLTTAQEHIEYNMTRVRRVYRRMTQSTTIHAKVNNAVYRVLHKLRRRGWELFHVLGWQNAQVDRKEIHLVFSIPEKALPGGHAPLAEVMVTHRTRKGGGTVESVENAAVRFEDDWEDWTTDQGTTYLRDLRVRKRTRKRVEEYAAEEAWKEVMALTAGGVVRSKHDFLMRIEKTIKRLREDGDEVASFEVEWVQRVVEAKGNKTKPSIRIALYTCPKPSKTEKDDGGMIANMAKMKLEGKTVGAVVVIDMSDEGREGRVKHICTIYEGEWPIAHHYRTTFAPPDLGFLQGLVRRNEM